MAIRVALNHVTEYNYDRPVSLGPQVVRLRPAVHSRTPILSYSLKITPDKHFINWQQDPFGNFLARLVFPERTRKFRVEVDLVAEMTVVNPFDFFLEEFAEHYPFKYPKHTLRDLQPYLEIDEGGPLLDEWLKGVDTSRQRTIDFLVALNNRLQNDIGYTIRMEPGVQSCEVTLGKALGSCRDSGWLLVQILRHLGLAARFVSGYLVQLAPDQKSLDGPSGPESDFTDLHAWTEVYLPGAGWVGLDPTSGLFAGEGHIPLSCTPEPLGSAPITGAVDKAEVEFFHSNTVTRIHEDPRVTKPYSEDQWAAINALGRKVEEELQNNDVRLTMGGEPTFVSIDDMDGAEWNHAAMGPNKRALAGDLLQRLKDRFGANGLLHFGQGKWYPGEPYPRWALGLFWRTDGHTLWNNQELLAKDRHTCNHSNDDALRFGQELTRALGVDRDHLIPAYEDTFYYLWKEGGLPADLDPLKNDLSNPAERANLRKVFERGLAEPAGFVLPVARTWNDQGWRSTRWPLRRGHLYLIPGDSPIGYRLPLDSLPWSAKEKRRKSPEPERSTFEPRAPLAEYHGEVAQRYSSIQPSPHENPQVQDQWPMEETGYWTDVLHTAMCLETREGVVHIFMPPMEYLEHWVELLAAIEHTASQLGMPVRLEGYPPPQDWRLQRLMVTPDPGVIEVNVHPARNWDELVQNTEILYEEARLSRLGTEKFMLDGRHTGSGGGNHVTLGGPTPADSPMLRRPDLLRSLITYWQHHPGLSYLFSGLFIGPTSQAPRVDEARNESLYELEIAFQQMPQGQVDRPWLVDRLLRNLLVDITGNTHRSEFCIDKLYSPDSASGRLGLLEFRAFEMPPHARMSVVQMLLLRLLVARFWNSPYSFPLVRWGTELHDRFMLPHYVEMDLRDVVKDLNRAGYPFQADWLDPFIEFRFPHYGSVSIDDIRIDLHGAIEPWNVLGEEMTNVGTARFVDSSVERLQVKVSGLTDSRYVLVCNGRRVPLHNTGVHGEYVAGVRFRAWQPPSALHPTIGIHSPLVFDLIDTWSGRSIGGCTYFVEHPGGRNSDIYPVNAYEAESRRISRFWGFGHTPDVIKPPPELGEISRFYPEGHPTGPMEPPPEETNKDYPYTLDLRRRGR